MRHPRQVCLESIAYNLACARALVRRLRNETSGFTTEQMQQKVNRTQTWEEVLISAVTELDEIESAVSWLRCLPAQE